MSESIEERNPESYKFQNAIRERLEGITSNYSWCETLIEPRVRGQSNIWKPDLVVAAEHVVTGGHLYLAMIECKGPRRGGHSARYWTHMSRAYMELNDLRLRREKGCRRFYLMVNRWPVKGESPWLDYPPLFKSIEVGLIHADDPEELAGFEKEIDLLCRASSPIDQLKDMDADEFEKFPLEVRKKAVERIQGDLDRLKGILDMLSFRNESQGDEG